jgi:hypothetical protein
VAERFPPELLMQWPADLQPSFAAVHLLLYALAEGGVVEDARRRLKLRLNIHFRTVDRHIKTLREMDLVRGDIGRLELLIGVSWPTARTISERSPEEPIRSRDPGVARVDPGIDSRDPGVARVDPGIHSRDPAAALVAALTTAKQSEARLAEPDEIDRVLANAEIYVPVNGEGRKLVGRIIRRNDPAARAGVAEVLAHERRLDPIDYVDRVVGYVGRYAALCAADERQRAYWSREMFSTKVKRRSSPWDVVKSAVDRASLTAPTRVDGVVRPGRYGGGEATF